MDGPTHHILFDPATEGHGLLADWATAHGHMPVPAGGLQSTGFRRAWNRLAAQGGMAVWMGYPIRDTIDLKAVAGFVDHVADHPGAWYYAPRPNDYLAVDGPVMVGMNPIRRAPAGGGLRKRFRGAARRLLASRLVPRTLRRALRRLGLKVWKRSFRTATGKLDPAATGNVEPEVQQPQALQAWPAEWQAWHPGTDVVLRDLVDRATDFFPHPKGLHVVLLNRCNLKCVMCPYHSPRYRAHHTSGYFDTLRTMDEETFRRIAEYAGPRGIKLQLGQIEEPLMHPRIVDFIRTAKAAGVPHIHVTTNGTLLTPDMAERLARSGIDSVMFSLDAATPETYREIRGSDLADVERKIRAFLPMARRHDIWVTVSFILQPEGQEERRAFLEKWRSMGVDSVTFYVLTEHDPATGAMIRTREFYEKGARYPCASPWVQTAIFPQGDVSLCCKTLTDVGWTGVLSMGNLRDEPLDRIWSGERFARLRKEVLTNTFDEFTVCRDCCIWSATSSVQENRGDTVRSFNETMETFIFIR